MNFQLPRVAVTSIFFHIIPQINTLLDVTNTIRTQAFQLLLIPNINNHGEDQEPSVTLYLYIHSPKFKNSYF
jgi:hypothetical protein